MNFNLASPNKEKDVNMHAHTYTLQYSTVDWWNKTKNEQNKLKLVLLLISDYYS